MVCVAIAACAPFEGTITFDPNQACASLLKVHIIPKHRFKKRPRFQLSISLAVSHLWQDVHDNFPNELVHRAGLPFLYKHCHFNNSGGKCIVCYLIEKDL